MRGLNPIVPESDTPQQRCQTGSPKTLLDESKLCAECEGENRQIIKCRIYPASKAGHVAQSNRRGAQKERKNPGLSRLPKAERGHGYGCVSATVNG